VGFLGKLTSGEVDRSGSVDRAAALDRSGSVDRSGSMDAAVESVEAAEAEAPAEPAEPEAPAPAPFVEPPAAGRSGLQTRPDRSAIVARPSRAPSGGAARGGPASIERQRELYSQSDDVSAAEMAAPVSVDRSQVNCPKCGKQVAAGTYFCACGQPL
jgi:hypothetical protein